ncbi:hypothetical protein QO008_000837 [Peptoniphilus ivorii]|uniref:hypothetical protein n=1 Tax=Aedoeadaptatus ivorii TaxID=54006 RepID=UPI00278130BE|nr:hypothetical protein [Peptoniphilus ivorii]MDQ0508382.1 hypothetical protein [Peptoniphilus ivorii]
MEDTDASTIKKTDRRELDLKRIEQSNLQHELVKDKREKEDKDCDGTPKFLPYQAVNIGKYIQKFKSNDFKEMVQAILEVEAPLSEALLLYRLIEYFDRKRVTGSVWDDYKLKMRGCRKYGIIRKNGFLYLDRDKDIQFRVAGDIDRSIEYIAPEELAAGMYEILKYHGRMEKKDLYSALATHCGIQRVGKEKKYWIQLYALLKIL